MSFIKYTPKLRGVEEGKRDREGREREKKRQGGRKGMGEVERGRKEVGGERKRRF